MLLAAGLALAGCGGGDSLPKTLMDGSPVSAPPVELEDVAGDAVLTKAVVVDVDAIERGSRTDECVRRPTSDVRGARLIVERVGVSGESVTLRDASGLHACDDSPGPREGNRRWCGSAFGHLYGGHLRDPRLDIGCRTADGSPMGFAWVEPGPDARYVAVEQPGYVEVYELAGNLPVRIATTSDVRVEDSSARFRLSEHDAAGRLLRRYVLEARVAG